MSDSNMLTLAIETYQRLLPELKAKVTKGNHRLPGQVQEIQLPNLSEMIEAVQPIPPQTLVIGMCEDNMPFLLDLNGTETGSLLITSDPASGKTEHLKVMAESAIYLNSPHEVQIAVITNDPEEWEDLRAAPGFDRYFLGIYAWYEEGASDLVKQLVSLGEDRHNGRHPGATVLLILDDLSGIFDADFEIQNGLHWLLEYGPLSHIRPVASIDAQLCPNHSFWVDTFRTFLIGRITSDSLAQSLGLSGVLSTQNLIPGCEFSAFTGQNWTRYHLPVR